MLQRGTMKIHFSIDDIIGTLRWAYRNEPTSIFDMRFFHTLKTWHEKYGMKVTLYMFFSDGADFDLTMLQEKYVSELKNSEDWMKVAYHGIYGGDKYIGDPDRFKKEMMAFYQIFEGGGLSQTVRLHCWRCPISIGEWKNISNGDCLLCPDETRESVYDLIEEEIAAVQKGNLIQKHGVVYRKTDIRCDYCEDINQLVGKNGYGQCLYVFLHEWRFEQQKDIVEDFLKEGDEFE